MAFEAISEIEKAEQEAAKIRADAVMQAKKLIEQAELDGRQSIETARYRAADAFRDTEADREADFQRELGDYWTDINVQKEELAQRADAHRAEAALYIQERIVNS